MGSLARSFNTMASRLDEVECQRRELVANVSHELRTPIAALRARLENLADGIGALDDEAVAAMLKGTERLSTLVDQLLELSQFESGAIKLDRRQFAVAGAVEDAIAEVRPVRADVRIAAEVRTGLTGAGDAARVHEVLTNLLSNAVRHVPAGGTVTVRGTPVPGAVRIEVSDDGAGIPPADAGRIFDRFYRVDSARGTGAGGAGLGLAIARSIVELHGGSIRAEPGSPSGCRIVVELPA